MAEDGKKAGEVAIEDDVTTTAQVHPGGSRGSPPILVPSSASRIGRFVVLRKLGEGGMGVVYSAYDEVLDRKVAVKLLRETSKSPDARARLAREAQAMARLSHPNVASIYEVGDFGGQVFVAMEFIQGKTLRAWSREKTRPAPEILAMYLQAGRGLAAAHRAGLVHRDFKPDNVIIGDDGRARVLDFGLARFVGQRDDLPSASKALVNAGSVTSSTSAVRDSVLVPPPPDGSALKMPITHEGVVMGTPAFMSPEQIKDEAITDKSDQWSFCVALYMALYGQHPFGTTFEEIVYNVSTSAIRPVPEGSDVPDWLRKTVLRGLTTDALSRWPSMDDLLGELERALLVDPDLDTRKSRRFTVLIGAGVATLGLLMMLGMKYVETLAMTSPVPLFVTGLLWLPIAVFSVVLARRWLWKGVYKAVSSALIFGSAAMAVNRTIGVLFWQPVAHILAADLVVTATALSVAAAIIAERSLWIPTGMLILGAIAIPYFPNYAFYLFLGVVSCAMAVGAIRLKGPNA
jgi:serine/threonine-protein kinase